MYKKIKCHFFPPPPWGKQKNIQPCSFEPSKPEEPSSYLYMHVIAGDDGLTGCEEWLNLHLVPDQVARLQARLFTT